MVTVRDIVAARARIAGSIVETPCAFSRPLGDRTSASLHLKLENLQRTGSFKARGASNKLLLLDEASRRKGIVAASAGNHAQGVAYAASRLGIDACIVMPKSTPLVKVSATRGYGARVELTGLGYDDAFERALEIAGNEGRVLVHPFDDEAVIAGQGTVGLEILEQVPDLEAVVVPVGGGGLLGGIACAIKSLRPEVAVYGVEAKAMASMAAALAAHGPVTLPAARTIADGIAVRTVGVLTQALSARYVDGVVHVDDEEIAEAILALLEGEKTVAEGAGAAALAAVLHDRLPLAGKRVVVVISGGNIDVNVVSRIVDRGLVKSGRLMRCRVTLPDVPGALARLLAAIGERSANVLQVHHDRLAARVGLGQAAVDLVLETRGFEHVAEVEGAITGAGFTLS